MGVSLVVVSGGYALVLVHGLLITRTSFAVEPDSRAGELQ